MSSSKRAKLGDLLEESSSETFSTQFAIFKYTVKHERLDEQDENPIEQDTRKAHDRLLKDQVIKTLNISDQAFRVNNTTFISQSDIEISDASEDPLPGDRFVSYGYCTRLLRASEGEKDGRPARSDQAWKSVVILTAADGKAKREWLRFHGLERFEIELTEAYGPDAICSAAEEKIAEIQGKDLKEATEAEEEETRGTNLKDWYAIWFEKEKIDLAQMLKVLQEGGPEKQRLRAILDAFVGMSLQKKFMAANPRPSDLLILNNRVFAKEGSAARGFRRKRGLKGTLSLVPNADKSALVPALSWTPDSTFVFPHTLVSDFILGFYRQSSSFDSVTLESASKMLQGLKIKVAIKSTNFNTTSKNFVIRGLGPSPGMNQQCLDRMPGNVTLATLRYPDMPCVNVGTLDKPYYFSSEVCLIVKDQLSKSEDLPDEKSAVFKVAPRHPKELPAADGDPFRDVHTDDFKLFFCSLSNPKSAVKVQSLRPEAWAEFQHELGERFNGKLRAAVQSSGKMMAEYREPCNETLLQLSEIFNEDVGIKNVLVIALPPGLRHDAIAAIRKHCDIHLGVQCCFVKATEVNSRYDPDIKDLMVKYTGQVVRKIFARANISGNTITENEDTARDLKAAPSTAQNGRLFGIHILPMRDFRDLRKDICNNVSVDLKRHFFVSVVSVSPNDAKAKTTYHAVTLPSGANGLTGQLTTQVARAFDDHVKALDSPPAGDVIIYQCGLPTAGSGALQDQWSSIYRRLSKPPELIMINMSQDSTFKPGGGSSAVVSIAQEDRKGTKHTSTTTGTSPKDIDPRNKIRTQARALEKGLEMIFRRPDGFRRADRSFQMPQTPLLVEYVHPTVRKVLKPQLKTPQDSTGPRYYPCLEESHEPDILYLARQASKRSRLHIELSGSDDQYTYHVRPVHSALQGSFYYL